MRCVNMRIYTYEEDFWIKRDKAATTAGEKAQKSSLSSVSSCRATTAKKVKIRESRAERPLSSKLLSLSRFAQLSVLDGGGSKISVVFLPLVLVFFPREQLLPLARALRRARYTLSLSLSLSRQILVARKEERE